MSGKIDKSIKRKLLKHLNVDDQWYMVKNSTHYFIPFNEYIKLSSNLKMKSDVDYIHKVDSGSDENIDSDVDSNSIVKMKSNSNRNSNLNLDKDIFHISDLCNDFLDSDKIDCSIRLWENQRKLYKIFSTKMSTSRNCFVNCVPGFGKTIFSIFSLCEFINKGYINGYVLIICDQLDVLSQWIEAIKRYSDIEYTQIKGKKFKTVKGEKIEIPYNFKRVILGTTSMIKYIDKYTKSNISFMILDEMDTLCTTKKMTNLLKVSPKYIIGLSATKTRNDGRDVFIDFMFGDNCIKTKLPKLDVICIKTNIVIQSRGKTDMMIWNNYLEDISASKKRNRLVSDIVLRFFIPQSKLESIGLEESIFPNRNKMILFCRRVEHMKLTSELIIDRFERSGYIIQDIVKSIQKSKGEDVEIIEYCKLVDEEDNVIRIGTFCGNMRLSREIDLIVTSIKKGSRGIDEVNSCVEHSGIRIDTCFFVVSIRQESAFIQALGRAFRASNPAAIHLEDKSTTSISHMRSNYETYKNYKMIKSFIDI